MTARVKSLFCTGLILAGVIHDLSAAEPAPRTSLSDPQIRYTVPEKPYAVLKRGDVEAVVVDHRAVDDAVLPGHRAGYSGIASLRHARQARNLFVPAYAGLNFEHIIDGTTQERAVLFEPRNFPMQLRVVDEHTAELYQAPAPHHGVESCHRFALSPDGVIEMTFECIPRRRTWAHDYLLFFWASYIDQPESLDIHFHGRSEGETGAPHWIRGITPKHGVNATHRAIDDLRELGHIEPFPLELPFGFSAHRYAEPWYFGLCRGMAFVQVFRADDKVRLSQSPSGGGDGCPAWDFQWVVPNCRVNQRYQLMMRALYTPWPDGAGDTLARESLRQRAKELTTIQTASAPAAFTQWDTYGGDPTGAKFSSLNQINRTNVGNLKPAWMFRCDDMRAGSTIECNPIIIGGLMYITTAGLKVVALDAASGKQRWVFDPWAGRGGRGVNRGVTYWSAENGAEARIFFVSGTTLHALDALTGLPVKSFGTDGRIDLREGLDRDVYFLQVGATSPGIVYKDLFILGSIVGEGPGPSAPGHIRAFDARTGKRRWIFHTIPHPGESGYDTWPPNAWKTIGGANCWGGMTLDHKRGMAFCGTGSPSYDHWGGNRAGQNLFGNCVLALRAETGERVWHYQVVHHDLWDYDIPAPPNLVTVNHGGRQIDAVAQVTKTGLLYVLDRETGAPLFPVEERPVPQSDVPGEKSWPTQPFPLKPPPFAQQGFTEANVTERTREARAAVLARLREMQTGGLFLPPGLKPSVVLPQFNGGAEWGGAAFDPHTRTLYVNSSSEAEWISMVPARPPADITLNELGKTLYGTVCSSCHGFEQARLPNAPAFASLQSVKQRLTRAQVAELLETGRGQMPSFKSYSAVEKRAVTAFLFDDGMNERLATKDLKLSWADEIPFVATGHHEFRDPDGFPANQTPWGTLTAIDLDRGEFRWQVPLGNYPALAAKGLPPTGTFNIGGPLVTAGGLVFIGAAMDEKLHAFDAETGQLLWEFQMEAGGYANPATYELAGRQYVVIAAGGGGKPETKSGNAFYCFALVEEKK